MIINRASKRPISESNDLPDMSAGIQMFFQKIVIEIVFKRNVDGYLKEETNTIKTQGVRVTQTSQQLAIKPEGERHWKWSNLFLVPGSKLEVDYIVKIQDVKYRVMQKKDNKEYSVTEYELLQDYEKEEDNE